MHAETSANGKKGKAMSHVFLNRLAMHVMVMKGNGSLRRLKKAAAAPMEHNTALLKKIVRNNRNTEFGKLHHFDRIRNLEDFRKNVPPSVYEDYTEAIERTKNGGAPLIPFESIKNTTLASFACLESLKQGKWIEL